MGIVRPRNLYVRRWTEYVRQEADRSIGGASLDWQCPDEAESQFGNT